MTARHVVVRKIERAQPDVVDALATMGTATVHEALGRRGFAGPELRPRPAIKDLALMCGCTREAAGRALQTLLASGYVTEVSDGLAVESKAIGKYLEKTLEHIVPPRPSGDGRG